MLNDPLCLALISLTTPILLSGVALAAFPIIAHLLNRWARHKLLFPTILLLRQSSAQHAKLLQMRRWLLLALRCLAVALLAFAFTRPVWYANQESQQEANERRAIVLVLDRSLSTRQQYQGIQCFDTMIGAASRYIDSLRPGTDLVNVVLADANPEALFPRLSGNFTALKTELTAIRPSHEEANFLQAIAIAGALLANSESHRELVFLTDLQKSNWEVVLKTQAAFESLPSDLKTTWIDLKRPSATNVALSLPRTMPIRVVRNQTVQLVVRASNFSAHPQEVLVQVHVAGTLLDSQLVRLTAGEQRDVTFTTLWKHVGQQEVIFEIARDALNEDNRAYLIVDSSRTDRILVVADDDPQQSGSGSYFLQRSLAPTSSEVDRYDVRFSLSQDIGQEDLASFTSVFLGYLVELTPSVATQLRDYVHQGGGVVLFCGEGNADRHVRSLDQGLDASRTIAPTNLVGLKIPRGRNDTWKITNGAWRSRFLRSFDERSQLAISVVNFRRIWELGPIRPDATVLLSFQDGTPALVAKPWGTGQFLLANFSPALESSDLGKYGAFVALMQIFAQELLPPNEKDSSVRVGQSYEFRHSFPFDTKVDSVQVTAPTGSAMTTGWRDQPDKKFLHIATVDIPGVYTLTYDKRSLELIAACSAPQESDLSTIDPATLAQHFSNNDNSRNTLDSPSVDHAGTETGRPLWGTCILASLGLLAIELILLSIWRR